jgi:L-amino acid N-acyltransferase YncA
LPASFNVFAWANVNESGQMAVEIVRMSAAHWEQVRQIYVEGLATSQATFETEAPSWAKWEAGHLPLTRLVAISDDLVIGWAALSAVSARAVYSGVAEVSVYVGASWRGKGIGRALLERLIEVSEEHGIWTLQASIFPENRGSLALHRNCGFREVGRRERIAKLRGAWRDTILLERRSRAVGAN